MARKINKTKVERSVLSDQIRTIIENCGLSQYRLAIETDIDAATLSRFMAGERGLSMKALDRLGNFLDLEIVSHSPNNPEAS